MPILSRFSGLHLSHEVGLLKPDPRYFLKALESFELDPRDVVFVDDLAENVAAAESVGIRAFVHHGEIEPLEDFLREVDVRI